MITDTQTICTVRSVTRGLAPGRSYRSARMHPSVMRRSNRRGSIKRWAPLSVAICSVLVTACGQVAATPLEGSSGQRMGRINSSVVSTPTPPATFQSSQVLSGWFAAESAFANAARMPDPYAPELAATTIDPQLSWSRALLDRMEVAGQIATGPVNYGTPRVIASHGDLATVRTCAWDAEIVVFSATGRIAPGIPGQVDFELFTSTMQHTEGGWKLLAQEIGVGRCDRL